MYISYYVPYQYDFQFDIYSLSPTEVYSGSQLVDGDEMKSYIELSSANI